MLPHASPVDLALSRFAAARATAARRADDLRYARISRDALIRRHGPKPADPQAASMLADLDRRIAQLGGW